MKVFNANSLRGIHSTLHGQKIVVKQRVWLTFLADKFQPRALLRPSLLWEAVRVLLKGPKLALTHNLRRNRSISEGDMLKTKSCADDTLNRHQEEKTIDLCLRFKQLTPLPLLLPSLW